MDQAKEYLFKEVPVEPDTTIIARQQDVVAGLDVLLEAWLWEGIFCMSAVIPLAQASGLSDDELLSRLRSELDLGEKITVKRKEKFVFVTYGCRNSKD